MIARTDVEGDEDAHSSRARRRLRVTAFAVVAVVVQVLPVWLTTRFPDQDGPAHLASAVAISGAYHGAAARVLHTYVQLRLDLGHSPLGHMLLAVAVRAAGSLTGQRLFLTVYLAVFALAGWYALSALRRDNGVLMTLLLPVGSGYFFLLGFWDFLLSLAGTLFVVGYWLRHHDDPGGRKYVAVSALLAVTSSLHPSGLIVGLPVVVLISVVDATINRRRAAMGLAAIALSCVPALVPVVLVSTNAGGSTPRPPLAHSLRGLIGLASVVRVLHSRAEAAITVLFIATLAGLAARAFAARIRNHQVAVGDVLFLVAILCALASFLAPSSVGGAELLNERFAVFAVVTLILWLGTQPSTARLRYTAAILGAVLASALIALRVPTYRTLDRDLSEITSLESSMTPGRTHIVVFGKDTTAVDRLTSALRTDPFRSVTGYFAAERELVGLDNYEGKYDYFPYQYVAARDPVRQLFLISDPRVFTRHPQLDLAGYTQRTGGRVDYIVVLGPPDATLTRQLVRDYKEVAVSRPLGLASLFALDPQQTPSKP